MNENVSTKIRIGEVRLSYCHLFEPEAVADGGDKKYSVSIIIPKSNKEAKAAIEQAYEAAVQAGMAKVFGGRRPVNLKPILRDGDLEKANDDAYADAWFINATSKNKPGIVKVMNVNGEKRLVEVTNEDDVYSGCYAYVTMNLFAYNAAGNKGIAAGINNVMKTRDGGYLGGRASAQSDFGDMDLSGFGEAEDDVF